MHPILRMLIRWQNPLMKTLLRSPLHGLVSRWYLIIGVTGRKTGHVYETPVQYRQVGETLWVVTSAAYVWWRNLAGGAPVTVILRGQRLTAFATPAIDAAAVRAAVHSVYPSLSAAQVEAFIAGKVALAIVLT